MAVSAELFSVGATITRAEVPALCGRLADRVRGQPGDLVLCDVGGLTEPDVAAVEALARLRSTARLHGRRLVVTGAGPRLLALIGLLGLSDVLLDAGWEAREDASFQVGGQAEEGEQAGGVDEVVDGRDSPV